MLTRTPKMDPGSGERVPVLQRESRRMGRAWPLVLNYEGVQLQHILLLDHADLVDDILVDLTIFL